MAAVGIKTGMKIGALAGRSGLPVKTLGLSLEEIQDCLAVHDAGELPCGDIQVQLGRQIERIDGQIKKLRQLRKELQGLLAGWQSGPAKDDAVICPNLHV